MEKAGTWFSYGEDRLGQGRENVKKVLEENSKLLSEIEDKVREKLGLVTKASSESEKKEVVKTEKVSSNAMVSE